MREENRRDDMTWSIGGHEQESAAGASRAESEAAKHSEKAEQTARENQAREDMQRVIDQYQGNASLIPIDDLDLYAESAEIYLNAVNDPNNNLTEDRKLVIIAEAIQQEARSVAA